MNSIYKFNFDFNEDILLLEYDKIKHKSENYIDRRPGGQAENWRIIPANFHYAKYLIKCFNLGEARPRFYTLPKGSNIPEHIDDQTKCSINILLETNNPAPVTIEGVDYFYKTCLLNTQKIHSVKNKTEDRILFKISIFDDDFETIKKKIKNATNKKN